MGSADTGETAEEPPLSPWVFPSPPRGWKHAWPSPESRRESGCPRPRRESPCLPGNSSPTPWCCQFRLCGLQRSTTAAGPPLTPTCHPSYRLALRALRPARLVWDFVAGKTGNGFGTKAGVRDLQITAPLPVMQPQKCSVRVCIRERLHAPLCLHCPGDLNWGACVGFYFILFFFLME